MDANIDNECRTENIDNSRYYKFSIKYHSPFRFDQGCFEQKVDFQDQLL